MACDCNRITATDADMRDSIRANYNAADPAMLADGLAWYDSASDLIRADAAAYGVPYSTAAAVYAACSINASWAANVTIARRWLQYATGGQRPSGLATVATRCDAAIAERVDTFEDAFRVVLQGADSRGSKVASFCANFHGQTDFVTVDRWAMVGAGQATATVNAKGKRTPCDTHGKAPKGPKYDRVADAYRTVAAELGITPRELQAAVWVAVRGSAN